MAIRGTYKPQSRRLESPIELSARQFARFVCLHTGNRIRVSQVQVLLDLITEAMISAMAQGYRVRWRGFMVAEMRVIKPRKRWDGLASKWTEHGESCRVHIKSAAGLTQMIVDTSEKIIKGHESVEHPVKNRALLVETTRHD